MEYRTKIMNAPSARPSDITVGDNAARFHEQREADTGLQAGPHPVLRRPSSFQFRLLLPDGSSS